MLSADEMRERVVDSVSPWFLRVMIAADPVVDVLAEAVEAAMSEQARYEDTPGHQGINESEIQQCVAAGLGYVAACHPAVLSPVDRPGLDGPMPFSHLVAAVRGLVWAQRAYAGMSPEPRPPVHVADQSGSGRVSFPWMR